MLDNLEQVIECGPAISRLLLSARRPVDPGDQPAAIATSGRDRVSASTIADRQLEREGTPAETLFAARAREASYDFAVSDENRDAIRQISRRLGGIPLAIELAASWIKVFPPRRLLENLDRQLDVLVRGPRDLPERQQTMRSAIAWSYQLLSESEQILFRQLGIFVGAVHPQQCRERLLYSRLMPGRAKWPGSRSWKRSPRW